ncbi:hypothetical protein LTR20_003803 [Exophiala xenobiotica]|nr:hypothetical protein LTS13_005731 [Exophiala xenobiotica]KAK5402212.1 hypothetical protein LTR79_000940 [Exophiala xenobiotica]KAK5419367.1 hypothetical protein LTR90_004430 [Exophiala xenobiotica]KAK5466856.1 hypothetical protein LTR20_003803 [Exophiala xenobiotica]KAK5488019.1 hypothetical protein LTR83_007655 [Exophiala xenobiotica]
MAVLSVPTHFPTETTQFNSPTETTEFTGREFFRARWENILEGLSEPQARVSYDLAPLRQVGKLNYQVCQRCVVASSNYAVDEICERAASRNHRGLFRLKTEAGASFDSLFYTDLFEHDSDDAAERIDPTTVATLGVDDIGQLQELYDLSRDEISRIEAVIQARLGNETSTSLGMWNKKWNCRRLRGSSRKDWALTRPRMNVPDR